MAFRLLPLSPDPITAVELASCHAPYIKRLLARYGEVLRARGAQGLYERALTACVEIAPDTPTDLAMRLLRKAKAFAHLSIAALDLSEPGALDATTGRLTAFADASVAAALQVALFRVGLEGAGLFVAALGKMGAGELNYSSDIDMAVFFDPARFDGGARDPGDAASRVTREAMRLLSEQTGDGYVFRTDLRLRPDPSSTPLAVSTRQAEVYYESVGQNWERMVWIKGRAAAGDMQTATEFFTMIEPFVWRRHLDYWAIADVQAIKTMINAKMGDQSLRDVSADLKLGVGGIREIEFFVQTQQIILGGRTPNLRVRPTLEGMARLVDAGAVEGPVAAELGEAYHVLRGVEHRIQMLEDEQTHSLPEDPQHRTAIAALCGEGDLATFDTAIRETRTLVNRHYGNLFAHEPRRRATAIDGNLVFTGVDDDPGTLATLRKLGFQDPAQVISTIRQWHRARTPATRTSRGRELLTEILPDLLAAMSRTGEADQAFARFSRFFEGLRSGVQTLSMLAAEPRLMEDLVVTLALAPRIGLTLARRPGLLEALISVSDRKDRPVIEPGTPFETAMDLVRHWHGERAFVIGHRLLHGQLAARDAADAWSDLAETCLDLMSKAALDETMRRFGPPPGHWTVAGLGKFGGREMTAGSDLDLLLIYQGEAGSDAQVWFTRFTQRLITALSAETGEGSLYDVDMRLRPSGRAGPVATSLQAFEQYHRRDAWTWEHMALTRLRPIAGDTGLGRRVVEIVGSVIVDGAGRTRAERSHDILDMRRRLARDKPPKGRWDLKMREGGLVDLEFIVQHAILTSHHAPAHAPQMEAAISALHDAGELCDDAAQTLITGFRFLQSLQQVQRLAVGAEMSADQLSAGLRSRLCRATGCADFAELEQRLEGVCGAIRALRCKKIGELATEA